MGTSHTGAHRGLYGDVPILFASHKRTVMTDTLYVTGVHVYMWYTWETNRRGPGAAAGGQKW